MFFKNFVREREVAIRRRPLFKITQNHIRLNDINKFNYSKVDVEDLAQRIIDIGKKCKSYGVNNIAISSVLERKNHEVNEVIKKVNNLLRALCLEQGFTFLCNSVI